MLSAFNDVKSTEEMDFLFYYIVHQKYSKLLIPFHKIPRFLNKECWCDTNLHNFQNVFTFGCHLYAGRIICEEQTIGKQVFLPAVSRRIPVSRSFIHSFIQLVWRLFHYTALSVVFSGRETH